MDDLLLDLRVAARTLARMRGVAVVAILTLALGIGGTTTMFGVVYAALLRPPPFTEPDRLMLLYITRTSPRDGTVRLRWPHPVIAALEKGVAATSFEAIGSFTGRRHRRRRSASSVDPIVVLRNE